MEGKISLPRSKRNVPVGTCPESDTTKKNILISRHKKLCPDTRHGTEPKHTKSTDSPPLTSYGTKELKLLRYMFQVKDKPDFSVRKESRIMNIARSTLYDRLNRLVDKKNTVIVIEHSGGSVVWD